MAKTLKYSLAVLFVIIFLWLVVFTRAKKIPIINKDDILISAIIDYPGVFNYRQTPGDCGPFSATAVVSSSKKVDVSPVEFIKKTKWRLPNGYTLPWGLELLLRENGISVNIPHLKLTNEEKIDFLKENLSLQRPIIILGELKGTEHYVTIFGFDSEDDQFYIYDSLHEAGEGGLTKDENGNLPGNKNFTTPELLNFWRGGGMYGLYNWYAIVASY